MTNTVNRFMYNGRWMDRDEYRRARGLDAKLPPLKNVVSTKTVMDEIRAAERTANHALVKEQLEDAGEVLEEYEAIIEKEAVVEGPKKYTGEKPIEDMDFFEMKAVLRDLGHKVPSTLNKVEALKLLTQE